MSRNTKNTRAKQEDHSEEFSETKGEQLDLLDIENKAAAKAPKTPKETVYTGYDGVTYSEAEWTSPVVANGPTRQEVEEWKERYQGEIYFTPFSTAVYVWRTLTRPEYREIISDSTLNALDREELFMERCIVYPRNFSLEKIKKGRAGDPSILSEMIMDKSGFVAQSAPIKL
jgi:hypothetical protein